MEIEEAISFISQFTPSGKWSEVPASNKWPDDRIKLTCKFKEKDFFTITLVYKNVDEKQLFKNFIHNWEGLLKDLYREYYAH